MMTALRRCAEAAMLFGFLATVYFTHELLTMGGQ